MRVLRGHLALEYALHSPYDVIFLDWMMPGRTGIGVCDRLRKRGYQEGHLDADSKIRPR